MNRLARVSRRAPSLLTLLISITLATACVPVGGPVEPGVNLSVQPHRSPLHPCEDRFVARTLDHITSIDGEVVRTYDSNGAGLAVNDLDRDGDLDLVLANLAGPNAIFWNQGDFEFLKQQFPHGQSRGVSIGDGCLHCPSLDRAPVTLRQRKNHGRSEINSEPAQAPPLTTNH